MFGTTAEREGGNRMPAVVYAREFFHPEDRAVLQEEMEKARDARGLYYTSQREHRIIRRDGEIRYIAVRIEVTKDAQGRIIKARGVNQDITERKRAEEALKESEERFRMLLQHVPSVAVQGYAMDGTTQYWNEASEKLYGYTAEEAIGKNLVDLIIPPEMRDDVRGAIRYMAETGLPIPASELSLMRKDGSRVALYSSHAIVRRSSGALELFCIDIDLSDRKRAEEALVDEMTKRKILIDQSRDGIVTLDESGKVYEANRRFAEMLGYTPEEMRELYVWDWDYQFSREQILGMIRTISAEGAHFESRHRRKDGSVIDVELSNNAATFSGKKLVFCVVRDITERKRMQDAVRESEEHYRSLAENVHDGIFIYQGNRFIFVNSLICKLTGYPKEELLAMDFFDLVHPDDRAEVQKNAERRARGEQVPDIYELRVVRKDGAVRYAELALSIILMKGGYAVLGAGRDITERRQAEEALRQANRKLTMLNSITRHDILNQLTALLGYLEFSKEDITDPAILEYVEKEDQAAKAIRSQIEFSRNYQDIGTQEPRWQLLPEVIGAGIRQLQPKGVAIDVDCAGVEVFADPLLEKVFYNLMENSRRHGEHVTRMKFACRETADGLVVTYTDDGVGISAKDKKNLFKRGFGKHTGLGLFLSQEILAITGITIAENGEPGTGVRFGITVPDGKWRRAQAG
jgi:PAS domain S-box-containing protein